jgi:glyoxylase-like metal-dependent hydrolase (beta-lactamase superfamily II)
MSQPKLLTEVVPGIEHWSAPHPNHGQIVHSHYLTEQRAAIDPIGAEGLIDALRAAGGVEQVILTNRHHLRGSEDIAREFGAAIRVPRAGLHEFEGPDAPEVIAYDWGDEVMDGVHAHEVGALAPDDGALHISIGPGALALADSLMMDDQGLGFVPDGLMDDPPRTKEGLLGAFRRLLDLEFDVLLLAHGAPMPAGGKAALAMFTESPRSARF